MDIMTHTKFHFNWVTLTLIFGVWASEPPPAQAWQMTEKARPDRVKPLNILHFEIYLQFEDLPKVL